MLEKEPGDELAPSETGSWASSRLGDRDRPASRVSLTLHKRDRKVERVQMFPSKDAALEAAGLSA